MTLIQIRRGTAAMWTVANTELASGEFGFETDTRKFKIGPGAWNSLDYADAPTVLADIAIEVVEAEIAGRELTVTDAGGGDVQFALGGVDLGDPFTLPAATWSGIAGKPEFTADGDTTAADITAWLAEPYDGWKRLVGSATLDEPFVIPSNTRLDATGATITLAPSSHCRLVQNAACTPLRSTAGNAVCVAGDNTVTTATGAFTSADIGRALAVAFTNESVRGVNAYGTITAINSSTSVEIDTAPLFSQTGGVARVYERDSNIEIRGGTWDRGSNGAGTSIPGIGMQMATLVFYRVDGVRLTDMEVVGTSAGGGRGFGVLLGDCTDVDADYRVDTSGDGIHLHGPLRDARIRVSGRSADDLIGITTTDYGHMNDTHGDIEDLDLWADGDPNAHRVILLSTAASAVPPETQYPDGHSIRRVRVHRAHDSSPNQDSTGVVTWVQCDDPDSRIEDLTITDTDCPVFLHHNAHGRVRMENVTGNIKVAAMPPSDYDNTASVMDDLTLVNCTGLIDTNDTRTTITRLTMREGSISKLYLGCDAVESVLMDRMNFTEWIFDIDNGCTVGTLTFDHCTGTTDYTAGIGRIEPSGSVDEINFHNCNLGSTATTNGHLVHVLSGASLGTLRVTGSTITGVGSLLVHSGSTEVVLLLSDVAIVGCKRVMENYGGANVKYANVYFDGLLNPFYTEAALTLAGSGFSISAAAAGLFTWWVNIGGGSVHVIDPAFRAKADQLAKSLGDIVYNTNNSLACGIGPVISDGSNWKHMYTGSTY